MPQNDDEILRARYEQLALSKDVTTTACDHQLRELEIKLGLEFIRDGDRILDVGCGPGVALREYAKQRKVRAEGIDYAGNMVQFAISETAQSPVRDRINFRQASVTELPYEDASFDVTTSHRCLMALLDWEKQKAAITEIFRVLKPGGIFVMMEGSQDGIDKLNFYRRQFALDEIDPAGRDRLYTLKFREKPLLEYTADMFETVRIQRFGMYYFLTRIVQPLLVAPDKPSYDHPLNEVAKKIAAFMPDFEGIGHLTGFVLRKRSA